MVSGDAVDCQLHRPLEGEGGAVGGPLTTPRGLIAGDQVQGGRQEYSTVV